MNCIKVSFFFFSLLMLVVGCDKENVFKNPTLVSFCLEINKQGTGGTDDLILDDGYIILSDFSVTGIRNQAENFEFKREFPNGLFIPFTDSNILSDLQFDLPQGEYKTITVRFETYPGNGINLFLSGMYTYNNPLKDPSIVHLEFNKTKNFEVDITNLIGNQELTLYDNKDETPQIIMNPYFWFKDVTEMMLHNATFNIVNSAQVITIDSNSNTNIFVKVDSMAGNDIKCLLF